MPHAVAAAVSAFAISTAVAMGATAATVAAVGTVVGSFAGAVTTLAIGAGLSALNKPKIPDTYAQLNAKRSSVADRTMLAGRVSVGGYWATDTLVHGTKNRVVSFVAILSGAGQCGSVEYIIYGDDIVYFNANGTAIGKYYGIIHMQQRNGSWSQTANSTAGGIMNGAYDALPDWNSNDKLLGCMNVVVSIDAGNDLIKADGIKNPIFVVNTNQTPLIDPRTGAAATTQAQFENPFVWAYSWARSLFQATPSGLIIAGLALASAGVHTASFADAANYADTNGFKVSAEINLNPNNSWENLRAISQAGGGDVTTRNGQLYATTASPKSIVGIITDDDCTTKPNRKALNPAHDRPNRIIPRFRSEGNRFEVVDGTPITDASFVSADGGKTRTISYELPFAGGGAVPIGKLAALALVNAREPWQYSVSLKPQARYLGYGGDCVQLDIARLGWTGKKVLIGEMSATIGLATNITAVSETDSKYPWALGQSTTAPDHYANSRFDARNVAQPDAAKWTTEAVQITSGGTSLPILRVTGDALDFADCTGVIFEYKPNSGSVWQMAGDLPRTTTSVEINEVTPNTLYNIRVSYKGKGGFIGTPRNLTDRTTGAYIAGSAAAIDGAPTLVGDVYAYPNVLIDPIGIYGGVNWTGTWLSPTAIDLANNSYIRNGGRWYAAPTTSLAQYQSQTVEWSARPKASFQLKWSVNNKTAGYIEVLIYWKNSSGGLISVSSSGFINPTNGVFATGVVKVENQDAPVGTATAQFLIVNNGFTVGAGGYVQIEEIKLERNATCTLYNDLGSLRLSDADRITDGSNGAVGRTGVITNLGISAGFAGQAPAATDATIQAGATVGATTGTNLTSPTYGTLMDIMVYTPLGVAAAVAGQGNQATANILKGVLSARPTTGANNDRYFSTDTNEEFLRVGTGNIWQKVGDITPAGLYLTATQDKASISGSTSSTVSVTISTDSVTFTPSGGTSPYYYSHSVLWEQGTTSATIDTYTGAYTSVSATIAPYGSVQGEISTKVRDATGRVIERITPFSLQSTL